MGQAWAHLMRLPTVFCLLILLQVSAHAVVDMKNANYSETWIDIEALKDNADASGKDSLLSLGIVRTYNSRTLYDGLFGFGWCSDLETQLQFFESGLVEVVQCGAGSTSAFGTPDAFRSVSRHVDEMIVRLRRKAETSEVFLKLFPGGAERHWETLRGMLLSRRALASQLAKGLRIMLPDLTGHTLVQEGTGPATLVFRDDEIHLVSTHSPVRHIFNRAGRLVGLRHRDGRQVDITYESGKPTRVQDNRGRFLTLAFDQNGKVVRAIQTQSDTEVALSASYVYNSSGDLIEANNAWSNTYRFGYGPRRNLNRIDFPDETSVHIHYDDEKDWVIAFQDRRGCVESYTYEDITPLHMKSHVNKRCGNRLVATHFFEFWFDDMNDYGKPVLQRVRSLVGDQLSQIDYDLASGLPIRISRDGVITTYGMSSQGGLMFRVAGDTKWTFLAGPDSDGFSVLEERTNVDGEPEILRYISDPWADPYNMPAPERERQIAIQSVSALEAAEIKVHYRASSEELDLRLERWHDMRTGRRFESAVGIAYSIDAEMKGLDSSNRGRMTLARHVLLLADELSSSNPDVSYALAQFVLRTAHDVESVDPARPALLIDRLSRDAGKRQEAILALREAIAIQQRRESPRDSRSMLALGMALAVQELDAGNPRLALDALRAHRSSGEGERGTIPFVTWPEESIHDVARIYNQAGLYSLALDTLRQSRSVFLALIDPSGEWTSEYRAGGGEYYSYFGGLADVESTLRAQGHFDDALGVNRVRVQRLFQDNPPPYEDLKPNAGYANILADAALTQTFAGQYAAASQLLEAAFLHSAGNDKVKAGLLNVRALLWSRLGLNLEAVNDSREAIRLSGADSSLEKGNLASYLSDLARHDDAEVAFEEAVASAALRLPGAHPSLANLRVLWADARRRAGRLDGAIELLDGAVEDLQTALGFFHWRVTRALLIRAEVAVQIGDVEGASRWAIRALASAYAGGLPEWRASGDHIVSRAVALTGNSSLAIFFAKRAVNGVQNVRSQLAGLDPQWQIAHMKARQGMFENATALLVDAGRIPEAQQVLTMQKLDELQQFTQRNGSDDPRNVRVDVDGLELQWQASIDQSATRLGAVSAELAKLEALLRLGTLDEIGVRRLGQLQDFVDDEQLSFGRVLDSIRREAEANERDLARNALAAAERAESGLRSLVSRLSDQSRSRVVALQYIVLESRLYILATTPELQFSKSVSLEGKNLAVLVQSFRSALQDTSVDPRPAAQKLYSVLVDPVATELKHAGTSTLMISLTGVLRYVPFAALHDGREYVAERYRIAMMTEASLTIGMRSPLSSWNVAALGVSTKVDPDFMALPGVLDEIAGVVRDEPGALAGALPGIAWIDSAFTPQRLQNVISTAPAVIHVASHFRFSPGSDTSSFLLLGDGTRLTLREMMGSRYRFGASDLLTLSACDTAVGGGRDHAGREVDGLAALAQRQGAPAVLATLWPVADLSTAHFMKRFYTLRQEGKGLSKSEALQRAQIEMIRGGSSPSSDATASCYDMCSRYMHPYFWAPFIILGNWL